MRPSRRWFLLAAGLILAGAAYLRCAQIDRRPLHADEAVQAFQTWKLLRGDGYTYDPADKHGPFLYYASAGIAKVSGWSPATLNETKLRTVTLFAGLGTLALLLGAAARLGRGAVLTAAAALAVAPLAVIYDTYFVQEAWFCFLTWALFFAALRLVERPASAAALLVGALAGLMQATKETSVLHFAALAVAWFAFHLILALLAAVFVYVLFYSAGFTRWAGVADGLRSYSNYAARAAGSAHDQPWYYYFAMLWPHTREGVRWGEPLLLVVALGGAVFAFSPRANPAQRAAAVFTLTLLLLYSLIPYKTPWLLLTPYAGLAVLAGLGAGDAGNWLPARLAPWAPALVCLVLLLEGAWRDRPALGRYANDERNPYLYQPTSADLPRLVAAIPVAEKIAVVSPDHAWPLPWYLRERPTVGYFAAPPANPAAYDLILLDSRLDPVMPSGATVFGLRPNVILWRLSR